MCKPPLTQQLLKTGSRPMMQTEAHPLTRREFGPVIASNGLLDRHPLSVTFGSRRVLGGAPPVSENED